MVHSTIFMGMNAHKFTKARGTVGWHAVLDKIPKLTGNYREAATRKNMVKLCGTGTKK